MADKNADLFQQLFDYKAMFIHMGASWGMVQGINLKTGGIHYKQAEVYSHK